jgi:hypothetical protein
VGKDAPVISQEIAAYSAILDKRAAGISLSDLISASVSLMNYPG